MTLILHDGEEVQLPDVTEEYFRDNADYLGASDVAYEEYKRKHDFVDMTDYRDDYLNGCTVVYRNEWTEVVMKIESVKDISEG